MEWLKNKAIVVPFDFSDDSVGAIKVAEQIAVDEQEIHVIHVVADLDATTYPGLIGSPFDDDLRIREAKEKMVEALCNVASDTISLEVRVGDPGHTIVAFAEQLHAGQIIMPSHGRRGIPRILMGSVTERVTRHAHCPVLVLKAEKNT